MEVPTGTGFTDVRGCPEERQCGEDEVHDERRGHSVMLRYIITREAGRERKLLLRFVCNGGHLKTGDGRCDGLVSEGGPGEPPGGKSAGLQADNVSMNFDDRQVVN